MFFIKRTPILCKILVINLFGVFDFAESENIENIHLHFYVNLFCYFWGVRIFIGNLSQDRERNYPTFLSWIRFSQNLCQRCWRWNTCMLVRCSCWRRCGSQELAWYLRYFEGGVLLCFFLWGYAYWQRIFRAVTWVLELWGFWRTQVWVRFHYSLWEIDSWFHFWRILCNSFLVW